MLVLPFDVPAEFARTAFERLESKFNLVTWESRYILNTDFQFSGSENVHPSDYVQDMLAILRSLNVKTCSLIGYCSGAGISLLAARQHPDVFRELILVSGNFNSSEEGMPPPLTSAALTVSFRSLRQAGRMHDAYSPL
jgi:pimeloyl-ACP methyl ester carboxylesterase